MQMTISPPTSSLGMEPYYVQPILLKSDHFSDLESSSNPAAKFSQQTPKPGYFCKSLWSHYLLLRLISLCITFKKSFSIAGIARIGKSESLMKFILVLDVLQAQTWTILKVRSKPWPQMRAKRLWGCLRPHPRKECSSKEDTRYDKSYGIFRSTFPLLIVHKYKHSPNLSLALQQL